MPLSSLSPLNDRAKIGELAVRDGFALSIREDGALVSGIAVRYGDVAELPWGRERIAPGAFGDVAALDVIANVQHRRERPLARTSGGGLTLLDDTAALTADIALPDTADGRDVRELVNRGVLRGLSVEFYPEEIEQGYSETIIRRATLIGLGIVDRPAYSESVIARYKAQQTTTLIPMFWV